MFALLMLKWERQRQQSFDCVLKCAEIMHRDLFEGEKTWYGTG